MDTELSIAILVIVYITMFLGFARIMREEKEVDYSLPFGTRKMPKFTFGQILIVSSIFPLIPMFVVYCIYKFFQYVVTIL